MKIPSGFSSKTAAFRTITRARRLDRPTQSAEEIFRAAVPLLAREANGRAFRLIGIGAHDLVGAREVNQSDLFAKPVPGRGRHRQGTRVRYQARPLRDPPKVE